MTKTTNLSGRWRGYYTQRDQDRPITAEFTQEGDLLKGTMADGCTDITMTISELVMQEGLPPGTDEQIVKDIRETYPNAPAGTVVAETHLPATSLIEGEVKGQSVRFLKTYQGEQRAGYRIGDIRMRWDLENYQVHYQGQSTPDGQEIEGQWRIMGRGEDGTVALRGQGGFLLRKAEE